MTSFADLTESVRAGDMGADEAAGRLLE